MASTGDDSSGDPNVAQPNTDRNPAPVPQSADIPASKASVLDESVKLIEDRIEKRTTQLKKLEKWIDGWADEDPEEDPSGLEKPRTDWLHLDQPGASDETRANKENVDEERITKVAAVHFTKEVSEDDYRMSKSDALHLVKEFNTQIAILKEYLHTILQSPLAEGRKALQAKHS